MRSVHWPLPFVAQCLHSFAEMAVLLRLIARLRVLLRISMRLPRPLAAAARRSVRSYQRRVRAGATGVAALGTTPDGTLSNAVRIRVDAAINPRASATL